MDVLECDRLGQLKLTREGVRVRNRLVYRECRERGIRLVVTMGGGYPSDMTLGSGPYDDIVGAHADVYVEAARVMTSGVLRPKAAPL